MIHCQLMAWIRKILVRSHFHWFSWTQSKIIPIILLNLDVIIHMHKVLKHMKKRYEEISNYEEDTLNVLKVIIYKNHNRFRNDKGFKSLKMVCKKFSTLKVLNFHRCVQKFLESLPLTSDLMSNSKKLYLPVKSNLEYFLVMHMKTFEICEKIHGLCRHASKHLQFRIKLGHFWDWAAFNLANISRLW